MTGKGYLFRAAGRSVPEVTEFSAPPDLAFIKNAVGGHIEAVPHWILFVPPEAPPRSAPLPCVVFCNEEGKLNRLPVNQKATVLWDQNLKRVRNDSGEPVFPTGLHDDMGRLVDALCGNILVLTGDAEFLEEL